MTEQDAPFTLDKRLIERLIKNGDLTREQCRAYLDSLPDASSKAVSLADLNRDDSDTSGGSATES